MAYCHPVIFDTVESMVSKLIEVVRRLTLAAFWITLFLISLGSFVDSVQFLPQKEQLWWIVKVSIFGFICTMVINWVLLKNSRNTDE